MTDLNQMTVGGYAPPPGPYEQPQVPQLMTGLPQWSNASPKCPPGLEYLTQIDQLLIKQKKEVMEVIFNFHTRNTYEISNSLGQHLWTAREESSCCARLCFGRYRPLTLSVKDNLENKPLFLIRPFRFPMGLCCWCNLCLAEMEVQGHDGTVLGFVRQQWHLCLPRFTVQTADRQDALLIHGPFCACSCGSDVKFKERNQNVPEEEAKVTCPLAEVQKIRLHNQVSGNLCLLLRNILVAFLHLAQAIWDESLIVCYNCDSVTTFC
uniref:phospholipid scramblase 2-like n=1 Tax=Myxine glutinosa TaxID=7769 RepID=UPI00358F470D